MKDYEEELLEERNQLTDKIGKLTNFIDLSPKFKELSSYEQHLLVSQRRAMLVYEDILIQRIKLFE